MGFDHRKLKVYHRALEGLELCDRIAAGLPPGRGGVRKQLDAAATSVVANIAEGAGEFSGREKARFYRMARRSAIETAAWLEICQRRAESDADAIAVALHLYEEVVAMLVALASRRTRSSRGQGQGQGQG